MDKSITVTKMQQTLDHEQISRITLNEEESPWNVIIADNIPYGVDRDKLISIFSKYGKIQHADVPVEFKGFARITYNTEEDAKKVWEESKNNGVKYDDHVLIITLASVDYCPIEELPDECLIKIFKYLTEVKDKMAMESVSKRWKNVSKKFLTTFKKLTYDGEHIRMLPHDKKYMKGDGDWIKGTTSEIFAFVSTHCKRLKKIDLVFLFDDYDSESLLAIFRQNEGLRTIILSFERMFLESGIDLKDVSSELRCMRCTSYNSRPSLIFPEDYSKFSNLEVLILEDVCMDDVDAKTFGNMKSLRKLMLSEVYHFPGISGIVELTNLEHLSIPDCDITDDIFEKVLKNNKKLKYLNVSDSGKITDASFKYVQQLSDLKVLIIAGLEHVTDDYFANMPTVRCVNANGCSITDRGVETFLETASNIEWLAVEKTRVTFQSVTSADRWMKLTGKSLEISVISGQFYSEKDDYEYYCKETYGYMDGTDGTEYY